MKKIIALAVSCMSLLSAGYSTLGVRISRLGPLTPRTGMAPIFICGMLLMVVCVSSLRAEEAGEEQGLPSIAQPDVPEQPVAVVNGHAITTAELDAHVEATQLSSEDALDDLIDLTLVRAAAAEKGISAPAKAWSAEERAGVELALAKALALEVATPRIVLIVDHVWLKDADDEQERASGRVLMERLRALVAAGATIPNAYTKLQVEGDAWHIGDHEEYSYDVIPPEARDLPLASLSKIIPGDGGLHLFVIHQRKQILPAGDEIRGPLRERLRRDAVIELSEQSAP